MHNKQATPSLPLELWCFLYLRIVSVHSPIVLKWFCFPFLQLVSLVAWSPCGNYVASASINGEMFIWKVSLQMVIER